MDFEGAKPPLPPPRLPPSEWEDAAAAVESDGVA